MNLSLILLAAPTRKRFYQELRSIKGLVCLKPDANFVFCRLPDQAACGAEVTRRLFVEHNIYIKHCQGKTLQESDRYVRMASRTQPENSRLVEALRGICALE